VNALANAEVGKYLNEHFVSSYQKVGTFQIVNGQKRGGNVASYFCLGDGRVLHAVAGPVDAATLLREARWVVETRKLALVDSGGDAARYRGFFRKAHADRLRQEHGMDLSAQPVRDNSPLAAFAAVAFNQKGKRVALGTQGRVHLLLTAFPLVKIEQVYTLVFEKVLGEKVSTLPVQEAGGG
jgi:hypothetical protein